MKKQHYIKDGLKVSHEFHETGRRTSKYMTPDSGLHIYKSGTGFNVHHLCFSVGGEFLSIDISEKVAANILRLMRRSASRGNLVYRGARGGLYKFYGAHSA